jgi:Protein of unknown function (DUF3616)
MYSVKITAAIVLLACLAGAAKAQDPVIPLVAITVDEGKNFVGKKKQPAATDISGMACVPLQGDTHNCLVINDENKGAQFAAIRNDRMAVGKVLPLIGKEADPNTLGSPPKAGCKEKDDFDNLDGEGVAYAESFFYVVGSHGCSRKKNKFQLSSFILARIKVDAQGRPIDTSGGVLGEGEFSKAVQTTYRVSDWLTGSKDVAEFFGTSLKEKNGLNIEGVAAQGDRIWFGLRAPITTASSDGKKLDKQTFIVGGKIADLFAPGDKPSEATPETAFFDLSGLGIRDLAALPDGRLLILAGPTSEEVVPYRLFVADPGRKKAKLIGVLPEVKGRVKNDDGEDEEVTGKAEGVALLGVTAGSAQAVILFDSLTNGAPRLAKFAIPD